MISPLKMILLMHDERLSSVPYFYADHVLALRKSAPNDERIAIISRDIFYTPALPAWFGIMPMSHKNKYFITRLKRKSNAKTTLSRQAQVHNGTFKH